MKWSPGHRSNQTKQFSPFSIVPWSASICLDSCAFDPKYPPEREASIALFRMRNADEIEMIIAWSVKLELGHPNTPREVKDEAAFFIYTTKENLTRDELELKENILQILTGNGKPENMRQDAEHVFEAKKYSRSFVTTDKRIIKKREELSALCGVVILLPTEMLARINKQT